MVVYADSSGASSPLFRRHLVTHDVQFTYIDEVHATFAPNTRLYLIGLHIVSVNAALRLMLGGGNIFNVITSH